MNSNVNGLRLLLALAFVVTATSASAQNLLANPSFEDPSTDPGVEYFGAGSGWTSFGGNIFTVNSTVVAPNTGNQSLKMFGACCSGAFQQFPAAPGETWNGGVFMLNSSADPMSGGQVAAVNIEWIQADGTTQSAITPFISNGTFTAVDAPVDEWMMQTITGVAPADAAFARLTVITGDFLPGGPGGAPFFDDAFFEKTDDPISNEDSSFGRVKALFEN